MQQIRAVGFRRMHGEVHQAAVGVLGADPDEPCEMRRIRDGLQRQVDASPVGAENCATLCDLGVFVDQPAEPVPAQNAHAARFGGWMGPPCGRVLVQHPVRPMAVVMIGVLAENRPGARVACRAQ